MRSSSCLWLAFSRTHQHLLVHLLVLMCPSPPSKGGNGQETSGFVLFCFVFFKLQGWQWWPRSIKMLPAERAAHSFDGGRPGLERRELRTAARGCEPGRPRRSGTPEGRRGTGYRAGAAPLLWLLVGFDAAHSSELHAFVNVCKAVLKAACQMIPTG